MPLGLIILLGVLSGMAAVSTDLYLPATPGIADALNAEQSQVQLTLAIFFMGYGLGQLLFGPLSDSLGRRPVLLGGLYLYAFASFLCAISNTIEFLTAARLLQAIGGCAAAVVSRAMIRDRTHGPNTAVALSGAMAVSQLGPLIAPSLGGLILLIAPWPATFVALLAYGLACIIATHLWIEESHPREKRQSLHPLNVLKGYWAILSHRPIVLLLLAEISATFSMFTFITGSALLFIQYYGLSAQSFGFLFSLVITGSLLGTFANTRFASKIEIKPLISIGLMAGIAGSFLLLIVTMAAPNTFWWFVAALWIALIPNAAIRTNYAALGFQYLPERTGTVAALFGAFSIGTGGITAAAIGEITNFTPQVFAMMVTGGYLLSLCIYFLWRLSCDRQHH